MQNANQGPAIDAEPFNIAGIGTYTSNTQVDNAGIDVRLTQLRNLLAGTRPQTNPGVPGLHPGLPDFTGHTNGDNNFILMNSVPYFMPNSIADIGDVDGYGASPPNAVLRLTPPVAGRWGEVQSVPGYPTIPNPNSPPPYLNLVTTTYNNRIRAGYSLDTTDIVNGAPRAAADDNYNQFDPFPIGHTGEVNDRDFFDTAGGLMLPVDRMRRFVTPVDIDGSGLALRLGVPWPAGDVGADSFGRVDFAGYFRPPGAPGVMSTPASGVTPGAIVYPSANNDLFYTVGPNPANLAFPSYLPDVTNNPLHGFEAAKNPNLPGGYAPQANGGMPADQNLGAAGIPDAYPTYDLSIRTNGLNEADEMNLYRPDPLLDSPFAPPDLEWLYRSQDVDGPSLLSRLADLAPVSFTNTIDGQRRRRLFAVESWESNQFVWANDNPQNAFPFNSRFTQNANAGSANLNVTALNISGNPLYPWSSFSGGVVPTNPNLPAAPNPVGPWPVATPSLAHRDKKINLNYPLPVSNDPNEPIRQKWISETYQLLKAILPPGPSTPRKSWPSSASS